MIICLIFLIDVAYTNFIKSLINKEQQLDIEINLKEKNLIENIYLYKNREKIQNDYKLLNPSREFESLIALHNGKWMNVIRKQAGANVLIESLSPSSPIGGITGNIRNLEIKCSGQFRDIFRFLHNIAALSNKLRIESVRMQATSDKNLIKCTLTLTKFDLE